MDKQKDVRRHASQLKVLARLLEHELDASQGKDLVLDRELSENILDTIEIFIEDIDGGSGRERPSKERAQPKEASVTRLN
ncbi:MAG: hypothetical protein KDB80_01860 [Planctomycetes bacterium]|nr:hypothetical protein [Planctomycetota bacterium]